MFKRCNVLYQFIKDYSDNYTPNTKNTRKKADDDLGGLDDGDGDLGRFDEEHDDGLGGLDDDDHDNGGDGKKKKNKKRLGHKFADSKRWFFICIGKKNTTDDTGNTVSMLVKLWECEKKNNKFML